MQVKSINDKRVNSVIDSVSAQLSISPHGIQLNLLCCEPNPVAILNYRKGKAEFALFVYQGILFFLCKFGEGDWIDAPFHSYINPTELRGFLTGFVPGKHDVALSVVLCDEHGNQKFGARLVTIGKVFSVKLQEIVAMQSVNSISTHEYERRIRSAFSKFTPERMVSQAVVKSEGGRDEQVPSDINDKETLQVNSHAKYPLVKKFMHVTLTTGHQCEQSASDITDTATDFCLKLIQDSVKTGWVDMSFDGEKYPLNFDINGDILQCKLCFPTSPGDTPQPAIIIVVALDARNGEDTWKHLSELDESFDEALKAQIPSMPCMPWIAVIIKPALFIALLSGKKYSSMLDWAGDFERTMAFSFSKYMNSKY